MAASFQTKREKPFYGKAVVDRKLRYLSASSIGVFDPTQEGGCNLRWFLEKIEGKKLPQTKAQTQGTDSHARLDQFLTTGENVLDPIVLDGLRFIPKPGPDLIVEDNFSDYKAALAARDRVMAGNAHNIEVEVHGIAALGIPVVGQMDLRHRRGEWLDDAGVLHREVDPEHTAESKDWKTSSDVKKYAKDGEALIKTVQMPIYAKATALLWPDLTAVRVSHGTFGTRKRESKKTTALMTRDVIDKRWNEIQGTVEKMIYVATVPEAVKVEANLDSCGAYRGCGHASYCPRPKLTIAHLLQIKKFVDPTVMNAGENTTMSNGLFDSPAPPTTSPTTNGAPAAPSLGLFGGPVTPAPQLPPPPPLSEEDRQAIIAAEKARLLAEDAAAKSYGSCGQCGTALYASNASVLSNKSVKHIGCPVPVVPVVPHIGAVNPPDAPPYDPVLAAAPLSAEAITAITDPALKAKAEAHAAAHAARDAVTAQATGAKEKTSGRCGGGGQTLSLTPAEAGTKRKNCPVCGKELKIKPSGDFSSAELPGHLMAKKEETSVVAPVLPAPPLPPLQAMASTEPPAPISSLPVAPVVPPLPPLPDTDTNIIFTDKNGVRRKMTWEEINGGAEAPTVAPAAEVPAAPAPLPPLPPQVAAPVTVPAPVPAVPAPIAHATLTAALAAAQGISLYVDVSCDKGDAPKSLEDWYLDIVRTIEKQYGLDDIRLVPDNHVLSFGKWRGALAAMTRANPPQHGEYIVRGVGESEIKQVIVEALAPMCSRVIRGSAR